MSSSTFKTFPTNSFSIIRAKSWARLFCCLQNLIGAACYCQLIILINHLNDSKPSSVTHIEILICYFSPFFMKSCLWWFCGSLSLSFEVVCAKSCISYCVNVPNSAKLKILCLLVKAHLPPGIVVYSQQSSSLCHILWEFLSTYFYCLYCLWNLSTTCDVWRCPDSFSGVKSLCIIVQNTFAE